MIKWTYYPKQKLYSSEEPPCCSSTPQDTQKLQISEQFGKVKDIKQCRSLSLEDDGQVRQVASKVAESPSSGDLPTGFEARLGTLLHPCAGLGGTVYPMQELITEECKFYHG